MKLKKQNSGRHRPFSWSTKGLLLFSAVALLSESALHAQATQLSDEKSASTATASREATENGYLRLKRDAEQRPLALQTSITRFQPKSSEVIVDLIAAVHIGEGEYYRLLGNQFTLYDSVLYELVAPDHSPRPDGKPRPLPTNPISFMQQSAKSLLALESQLEKIDYRKANFVHADLTPSELADKMASRGESVLSIGLSTLSEMLEQPVPTAQVGPALAGQEEMGIFELLNNPLKLKQVMAVQFAQQGAMEQGLGKKLNRLLISDRNAEAMRVLKRQLDANKKHIAIFYGAAHMPDFEKRLRAEFAMEKTEQVWVNAWDLTKANATEESPIHGLLKWMQDLDLGQ